MANGGQGLPLVSSFGLAFRRARSCGSPTLPACASATRASARLWQYWFFGHGAQTAQGQTATSAGQQTGSAGVAASRQSQTASGGGTVAPLVWIRPLGKGLSLATNGWAWRFRQTTSGGALSLPTPTDRDPADRRAWQSWLFGSWNRTRQGQSLTATGLQTGIAGKLSAIQSQTLVGAGQVAPFTHAPCGGRGFTLATQALSLHFRAVWSLGTPALALRDADPADRRAWTFWYWGQPGFIAQGAQSSGSIGIRSGQAGPMVAGQGCQSLVASGLQTGSAGIDATTQGAQTAAAAGAINGAAGFLVYGGEPVSTIALRALLDGTGQWTANLNTVRAMVMDAQGHVYVAGNRRYADSTYTSTWCFDSSGALLWSDDHGDTVYALALDASGHLFTGGEVVSGVTTRKYNAAGQRQAWTANHGAAVRALAIGASGKLHAGGDRVNSVSVRIYGTDGTQAATIDFGADVYALAVDASDNLFIGGATGGLRKLNASQEEQWRQTYYLQTVYAVGLDANGDIFACNSNPSDDVLVKLSADGSRAWTWYRSPYTPNRPIYALAVDHVNVYCAGERHNNQTIWKLNSAGSVLWSGDHGDATRACAIGSLPRITAIPAIPWAVALAAPFPSAFHAIPAAPLAMALAAPEEFDFEPPDVAFPNQLLFRAFLTGIADGLYEVPLASLQCRRRYNESTWLTVRCPRRSTALRDAIQARIGGELVIDAGTRESGRETLGHFLRATVTQVDDEQTPQGGWLTVTARVQNPSYQTRNRLLTGIRSYRVENQRRIYTCRVDPLLRPHDTIIGVSNPFPVLSIEYRIDPQDSWMTVTEDAS